MVGQQRVGSALATGYHTKPLLRSPILCDFSIRMGTDNLAFFCGVRRWLAIFCGGSLRGQLSDVDFLSAE
jgi:hypothetical protein